MPSRGTDASEPSHAEPPVNGGFPGYDFMLRAISTFGAALDEQGNLWNDAWSKLRGGSLGFSDYTSTVAKSVEAQFRFVRGLLSEAPSAPSGPTWVHLTWTHDDEWPLSTVATVPALDVTETLQGTPLASFGSEQPHDYAIAPQLLDATRIRIEFTPGGSVPPPPGLYLAFVFKTPKRAAPLVIVSLEVSETTPPPAQVKYKKASKRRRASKR
ncbi:MAG TPA: hypothetical protein VH142_26510 [Polyangiaceae bacterium]|nr:hypothetical protein [Polyangiaceae bacterium]